MANGSRLPWPRYSIRWLFAAMFAAALSCGWYAALKREKEAQTQGASIHGGESAFQRASFAGGRMSGAALRGDVSTFQLAQFDRASLNGATLTADGASFQGASFAAADLRGAEFKGRLSSFQRASFSGANLSGARLAILRSRAPIFLARVWTGRRSNAMARHCKV